MNKKNIEEIKKEVFNKATLIVVTKTVDFMETQKVIDYGIKDIGENRIKTAKEKFALLEGTYNKHLIGHLQTNKVKEAVEIFDYIHSVDSLKLARKIDQECSLQNKKIKVFYQLNISGEKSKHGFSELEFKKSIVELEKLSNYEPIGFMTMAPFYADPEKTRWVFDRLRLLSGEYDFKELSMGMSSDYKIALEAGATFVRIGSRVFE